MDVERLGKPTLQTRVERWECDFNDHWNVRFYVRSFQLAAEAIATAPGSVSAGAGLVPWRHLRFHRELFVNAPVEVRSARVADGLHQGAVVHFLSTDGRLAATAMDPSASVDLPWASAHDAALALPRGLVHLAEAAVGNWTDLVSLGPIRPAEVDHTGALLWEELVRRLALSSHGHVASLGFSADFVAREGINRMSAEMRIDRMSEVSAGTCLWADTRLVSVRSKGFSTEHRICAADGTFVASIRQNLLTVDLKTRRAVEVPAFLRKFQPDA